MVLLAAACVTVDANPSPPHGVVTQLTASSDDALCSHRVPEEVCVRHHPEVADRFRTAGDWCGVHSLPESQDFICHPDLDYTRLPEIPEGADVRQLSSRGEDVPDLLTFVAADRPTVFFFYSLSCVSCRRVEAHLREHLRDRNLSLRRLNIASWNSNLASHYLPPGSRLPHLLIVHPGESTPHVFEGDDLGRLDEALTR